MEEVEHEIFIGDCVDSELEGSNSRDLLQQSITYRKLEKELLKDLRTLPKFHYTRKTHIGTPDGAEKQDCELPMKPDNKFSTPKPVLDPDYSDCCICLHSYYVGVELCSLCCRHLFHRECINKWLLINATCPLCELSIIRGEMLVYDRM